MPMRVSATMPKRIVHAIIIHAKTGFLMETSVMFTARRSACGWPRFRRPCAEPDRRAARAPPVGGVAAVERDDGVSGAEAIERVDLARASPARRSTSASTPRTTSSSPAVSPLRTSTQPSLVFMPSVTTLSCATSPSTT